MVAIKHKISISVSEETLLKVREAVRGRKFRNRSHAFEAAVNAAMGAENE